MKIYQVLTSIVFLGTASFSSGMEKFPKNLTMQFEQVPSLKMFAAQEAAKDIKTLADFQKKISRITTDLHCEVVKAAIKSSKADRETLLQLVDTYCAGEPLALAFKAYVWYKTTKQDNPNQKSIALDNINRIEELTFEDNKPISEIARSFYVTLKDARSSLFFITMLITHQPEHAFEFLRMMGEKPAFDIVGKAVMDKNPLLLQRLLVAGAPVDDPDQPLYLQPLKHSIQINNQALIDLLIQARASITKKYMIAADPRIRASIADNLRRSIQSWLDTPADQKLVLSGETIESITEEYRKQLELINKYEKLEQEKK